MKIKPPILVPVIDANGMVNREWAQFFAILAKAQIEVIADATAKPLTIYYSTNGSYLAFKDTAGAVKEIVTV